METAMNMEMPKESTIADTCMLAVLTPHKIATSRRADRATETRVRQAEGDDSITVIKHLFRQGPVADLLTLMGEAYREHIAMTAPWADKGPRILPAVRFEEYRTAMNGFKEQVEIARRPVLMNWDQLVHDDMQSRVQAGKSGVSFDQYPTRAQLSRDAFTLEWRPQPIANEDDFRVAVPEEAKQQHRDYLQSAVDAVRNDLLKRMLVPIQKAAERLAIPIGEKHSNFNKTLVTNMQDALAQAKLLNVSNDPDVADVITSLDLLLTSDVTPDSLKTLQQHRDNTAAKLATISAQFGGLI